MLHSQHHHLPPGTKNKSEFQLRFDRPSWKMGSCEDVVMKTFWRREKKKKKKSARQQVPIFHLFLFWRRAFREPNDGVPQEDLVSLEGRAPLGHLLHGREWRRRRLVQQRKTLRGKKMTKHGCNYGRKLQRMIHHELPLAQSSGRYEITSKVFSCIQNNEAWIRGCLRFGFNR